MITDRDIKKVKEQGFDEALFCDAASFLFQEEFGVNRYNEPANASRSQIDWGRAYIQEYDGTEGWFYSSLEEDMYQDLEECRKRK